MTTTARPRADASAMSAARAMHLQLTAFSDLKARREPIVMVTAYDAPSARLADEAGVDIILVGDSAANNMLGYDSTTPVTMDEMVMLTRAARRGTRHAFLLGDLPFGSYQVSDQQAIENSIRLVKEAGADGVKLEGAGPSVDRARALAQAGIPVMGHLGLTPQSVTMLGGFKAQGRTAAKAMRLLDDALALQAAGCFSIVLEAVSAPAAEHISRLLKVPTIGIGSGVGCDGQVLVWHDLLGLTQGQAPRFVKAYADLAGSTRAALEAYAADVRSRAFPEERHTYGLPDEELAAFEKALEARRSESA
jgi:3-methyl-2-oxobutanoate hydroxymethyltransferase